MIQSKIHYFPDSHFKALPYSVFTAETVTQFLPALCGRSVSHTPSLTVYDKQSCRVIKLFPEEYNQWKCENVVKKKSPEMLRQHLSNLNVFYKCKKTEVIMIKKNSNKLAR